jgi:hypothetical protein
MAAAAEDATLAAAAAASHDTCVGLQRIKLQPLVLQEL